MQIQNKNVQNGLLVVSGREHGRLYTLQGGTLSLIRHIKEPPPTYSDNEGFFVRSGEGQRYGSGNPREDDSARNLERYIYAISTELTDVIREIHPSQLLIIEPEHLKGQIQEHVKVPNNVDIKVIDYGNFVDAPIKDIAEKLESYGDDSIDPADPASVAGEENAEEKRKLLETAERLANR